MELTSRDRQVITTIEALREKHHACTAAGVAATLKISRAYMHEVMHDMITRGILTFEAEMPGSLRVVEEVRADDAFVVERRIARFHLEVDHGLEGLQSSG